MRRPSKLQVHDMQMHAVHRTMAIAVNIEGGLSEATVFLEGPGGSVHGERANFTGLVLGCIDADFCK